MPTHRVIDIIEGQPTFEKPLDSILSGLTVGGAIKTLTPLEYITERQRAWWKGVLLPALANHTGDSTDYWESRLKLKVMPDEFQPKSVAYGRHVIDVVPSITILGKRKMSRLIQGSVDHLHNQDEYGDEFSFITEPDEELRSQ